MAGQRPEQIQEGDYDEHHKMGREMCYKKCNRDEMDDVKPAIIIQPFIEVPTLVLIIED